ncbi:GNAT family N-acetyltransferase [Lachnobacterium bovis]|uniref:Ribosomal protein S18 acetylase RimI n=1 Tax=Lachnobacterium bovis TaxID=140626 RepID=A0A1H9RNR4_9FIRM|nr:GNAT family N-acetyltransferase [Lachnobacterium bovis]SER74470.1 Ribosomal protein S18 acetylase RimI [Lachnobacterium bovis]
MITRMFNPNEARMAVRFARDVYQLTFNENYESVINKDFFMEYADEEQIARQVSTGDVVVFGTVNPFGEIMAVAAIDAYNYITMLLVAPKYTNMGIGKQLLANIEEFVKRRPINDCIKINLTRTNLINYFLSKRFYVVQDNSGMCYPFIRLYKPLISNPGNIIYQKKPVDWKIFTIELIGVFLVLIFLVLFAILL